MTGERVADGELVHAVQFLRTSGAFSETLEQARHYGRRAIDALALFPSSKAKGALTEAVEFAVARAY
jgi:octaprenyl-diphosphate synthase